MQGPMVEVALGTAKTRDQAKEKVVGLLHFPALPDVQAFALDMAK